MSSGGAFAGQLHAVQVLGVNAGAGAGVHVSSLVGGLTARGVEVTVCGPAGAEGDYAFGGTGARYVPLDVGRRRKRGDAPVLSGLRAAFRGASVVHAHGLWAGFLAAVALRGQSVPLVVTWHGAAPATGGRAKVEHWLERRALHGASVVLAVSSELVDRARALGGRDVRLAPAAAPRPQGRPPRPPEEGERLRQKTRADHGAVDRPLVLAVGRLEPEQGYDLLLDAARIWTDRDPAPLVVIAGEGGQRAALERRIEAARLPVLLLGARGDVPDLLAAADVVVLPSRWEARALVAQEALHAGVPLVATDVGGTRELVGEAAVLVPYGDPRALARAVTGLLADPDRRAALTIAGRAQAATWPTEDDTVAQVLSVYDELTQPRRP